MSLPRAALNHERSSALLPLGRGAQPIHHPSSMFLKVDPLFGRIGREPRTIQNGELVMTGKFMLRGPRRVSVADASMNQNETLH